ncbi:MAG TPA: hypothetical protein VMV69_17275 [Pirellulales bacterium]|nr:hypothetical protein [Pirellulales bacterium]
MDDEGLGNGGRRLEGGVGHEIQNPDVDLVANADPDRHGRGGDGPGDLLIVEPGEIHLGAATAHEADRLDAQPKEVSKRCEHLQLQPFALHTGRCDDDLEREAGCRERFREVVVGGGVFGRDEPDPQHGGRQLGGLVLVKEMLRLEPFENLPPVPVDLGFAERRVNVMDLQLEAVDLVKFD